jgi:ATP-dependent helicase/nuclease subunit A
MSEISKKASYQQAIASDPDVSAWVSANAGSGKTHVLVNRVIRLMLTGTRPEKILCLTYTRAAAAEMSNRLYKTLAEWIPLEDERLIEEIHKNTGHFKPEKDQLAEPRRLFARALETPGGLKIQTIHAFCEQLLHRFPVEAGITAGFEVMDDRQSKDLRARIQSQFLSDIALQQDRAMADHLANVVRYAGGQRGFEDLMITLLNKRSDLDASYEDLAGTRKRLQLLLGVEDTDTTISIAREAMHGMNRHELNTAAEVLKTETGTTFIENARILKRALASDVPTDVFSLLRSLMLTLKGQAKKSICSKNVKDNQPHIAATLDAEKQRILALSEKAKAVDIYQSTCALLQIGREITRLYDREKKRLGFYDYHDLIARVLAMFAEMPDASWVLFKLDGGLDHILIDEAQDTSPEQWRIMGFLADEFFTGAGARGQISRSIFAVGDHKQSIYSFQGAAPKAFAEQRVYFDEVIGKANKKFKEVTFEVSFRSTCQVLETVDKVFAQAVARNGVGESSHSANRINEPGLVELWPLEDKAEKVGKNIWNPAERELNSQHSRIKLAAKVAKKIAQWLNDGDVLETGDGQRAISPGDILILVRNRTQMMDALVRALKLAGIPVAGVDRLKLTRHIAVQDLLALARFALLPGDDLNFAGLLKSSLLEKDNGKPFDDNDLIELACNRGPLSLWSSFEQEVAKGFASRKALQQLKMWRQRARVLLPFEFFASVLTGDNIRPALLTRLGQEASEPLDAFLELTREFERSNTPSLQGFLSWIETSETEIKRELEQEGGQVRIMTIHGAKGLEAPIVILPDTYEVPDSGKIGKILFARPDTPVWRLKSEMETPVIDDLKANAIEEANEEYNRLLYVAMTRAKDRLYIGAAEGKHSIKDHSWYQLVKNIICTDGQELPDDVFGTVWRFGSLPKPSGVFSGPHGQATTATVPDWIRKNPPAVAASDRWVAPSKLFQGEARTAETFRSPLKTDDSNRYLRGNLIHRLLQYLPDLPAGQRWEKAKQYLDVHGRDLSGDDKRQALEEIISILQDTRFAKVFSPNSQAEVPVVARIKLADGSTFVLNGQIDRLAVDDNEVLIVDYKTNRPPPANLDGVNLQYINQLAAYRLALADLYPDQQIRAALLWTHNTTLMEIPPARLIAALN